MSRLGAIARSIHRSVKQDSVDVSESNGIRSLHLGSPTVQSAMRVNAPYQLELNYTRGMMAYLLFSNKVTDVLGVGLGGGSVAKYIHHYLPQVKTRVVEINPQIIKIARTHFSLPDDDERLQILEGDGAIYIKENPSTTQVLMIDAFDSHGIPPDLCSQDFFDACAEAITLDGMLVINLWGSDRNFDVYCQRIEQSFHQRVLVLPTGRPGNIVVFGFKRLPRDLRWASLRERAKILEAEHKIEFLEYVEKLREHNHSTNNRLLLEA